MFSCQASLWPDIPPRGSCWEGRRWSQVHHHRGVCCHRDSSLGRWGSSGISSIKPPSRSSPPSAIFSQTFWSNLVFVFILPRFPFLLSASPLLSSSVLFFSSSSFPSSSEDNNLVYLMGTDSDSPGSRSITMKAVVIIVKMSSVWNPKNLEKPLWHKKLTEAWIGRYLHRGMYGIRPFRIELISKFTDIFTRRPVMVV